MSTILKDRKYYEQKLNAQKLKDAASRMISTSGKVSRSASTDKLKNNTKTSAYVERKKERQTLTGPTVKRDRDAIRAAFDEARHERIKKKFADRRNIRNGSGGSHGF